MIFLQDLFMVDQVRHYERCERDDVEPVTLKQSVPQSQELVIVLSSWQPKIDIGSREL